MKILHNCIRISLKFFNSGVGKEKASATPTLAYMWAGLAFTAFSACTEPLMRCQPAWVLEVISTAIATAPAVLCLLLGCEEFVGFAPGIAETMEAPGYGTALTSGIGRERRAFEIAPQVGDVS